MSYEEGMYSPRLQYAVCSIQYTVRLGDDKGMTRGKGRRGFGQTTKAKVSRVGCYRY